MKIKMCLLIAVPWNLIIMTHIHGNMRNMKGNTMKRSYLDPKKYLNQIFSPTDIAVTMSSEPLWSL